MPYITKEARALYDEQIDKLVEILNGLQMDGHYTYVIYKILMKGIDPLTYADFSMIEGILQTCSKEIYRRHTAPYEDRKIEENGDV